MDNNSHSSQSSGSGSVRRRRLQFNRGALLALMIGVGLSLLLFDQGRRWERQKAAAEFDRRTASLHQTVDEGIEEHIELVLSMRNLSVASNKATEELANGERPTPIESARGWVWFKTVFRQSVDDAQERLPGLRAIGWVGHATPENRAAMELNGKLTTGSRFSFQEMGPDGELRAAANRMEYFPVLYLEPIEENRFILGLDLGDTGKVRPALERARDNNELAATPPIHWIETITGSNGVLVFAPIYDTPKAPDGVEARRQHIDSFVIGVYLIEDLLDSAFRLSDYDGIQYFVYIDDVQRSSRDLVYASDSDSPPLETLGRRDPADPFYSVEPIHFADQAWTLVCYPTPAFLAGFHTWVPWAGLSVGLAFTAMVCGLLLRAGGRAQRIERIVAERTHELSHSNQALRREIAVREEAEARNEALQRQLAQKQRLESVGELAGGVAHDFNNLLIAVLGYSDLALEEEERLSPQLLECLTEIHRAGERASMLTQQLLAFSRRQIMNPVPLEVGNIVTELEPMLRRLLPENIALDHHVAHDLEPVCGDPGQLEQVIVNLVLNARDSMEDGGRITVSAENVDLTEADMNGNPWTAPGRYVCLAVSDSGEGIPPEVQERIFEPFFTTKEGRGGTGLGLAVVYGIIKQHDGCLNVDSHPGDGTTISVCLPVTTRPVAAERSGDGSAVCGGHETILLVEDEAQVRRLARRILESAGYTVLEATDGAEGLDLFEAHAAEIDLVITDVVMPNFGGKRLMLKIRKIEPSVPVLFTSGYSSSGIHTNFILQDGLEFIQKPYRTDALRQKVRELLDARRAHSQNVPK